MIKRSRKGWILFLVLTGLALATLILFYSVVLSPTVLVVSVVDTETGDPLSQADVWVLSRGRQPLTEASTDATGRARFQDLPPGSDYGVRVQKIDYDMALASLVSVPEGKEREVTIPLTPHAGSRLFVGLDESRIAQIDTASLLVVQIGHLPSEGQRPVSYLLIHPHEDLLYAVAGDEGCILDSRSGALLGHLEIKNPWRWSEPVEALGLSGDGQHLYVWGTSFRGPLMILDAHDGQLISDTIPLDAGEGAKGFVVQKSNDPGLYVVRLDDGSVHKLESIVQQILDGLPIAGKARFVLSDDERYLYTYHQGYVDQATGLRSQVESRRVGTRLASVTSHTLAEGISALAVSPTKREVYVLNSMLGTLTILDPTEKEPATHLPVGREPETLVISPDGTRAYVANRTSQTISVVDLSSAAVLFTIALPGQPLSVALR